MKVIKLIWEDIQHGKNLDLYLAIPTAFTAVVFNFLGIADVSIILSLILALTGVLAISALTSRHTLKSLKAAYSVQNFFLEKFPDQLNKDIKSATELWLVGVTLNTPINVLYSIIEDKLAKGHSINVLLVHPVPEIVQYAELRAYAGRSPERTCDLIKDNLRSFADLKKISPNNMIIKTIHFPLGNGIVGIDPETINGVLYVSNYPFRTKGGSLPKFILNREDGKWYTLFKDELLNLWDQGKEWNPAKSI